MITSAGIYDIDIDLYHSQKVADGASVSSSSLRKILRECAAKFFATSDLNPKCFPSPDKKPYSFGRAAHALMLGEPEFNAKFIITPFDNFMTKEARTWRDAQTKQILKPAEFVTIQDMCEAQKRSEHVSSAFTDGRPEMSILWKDEETGIWLKVRPDWLPNRPAERFVTEYKTAESIAPRRLNNAVFDYGYEMQAAMMIDGVETVMDNKALGIAHIVQEKDPPYLVDGRFFTGEQLAWGRKQYRKALRIFARCLDAGHWPGYTSDITYFETPYWVSKAMENFNDSLNTGTGAGEPSDAYSILY